MRLNLAVIVGCLLLGLPVASFGAKFNQDDLFKTAPTSANASNAFANTVSGIKDAEKAAKAREYLPIANAKIAQHPNNDKYYAARAQIYSDLGNYKSSLLDIAKAIELKPATQIYYEMRAGTAARLMNYSLGLQSIDKAIAIGPVRADLFRLRADQLYFLDRYSEALAAVDHAIELDPKSAMAYVVRGQTKFVLKDYKGALSDCEQAELMEPGNTAITAELRQSLNKTHIH
jgi:tetratricopeptide (TPR) repeat protein